LTVLNLKSKHPVVLFDGVCNLCNSTVSFIIKRDKNKIFRFAHLQSESARTLLEKHQLYGKGIDSIVYIEKEKSYISSTAVLKIFRRLKMPYPLLYFLIIIPPFIRNAAYDVITRNRYRWFGKSGNCIAPASEYKERFLE